MVMERIREAIIQSDEPWNETEKKPQSNDISLS